MVSPEEEEKIIDLPPPEPPVSSRSPRARSDSMPPPPKSPGRGGGRSPKTGSPGVSLGRNSLYLWRCRLRTGVRGHLFGEHLFGDDKSIFRLLLHARRPARFQPICAELVFARAERKRALAQRSPRHAQRPSLPRATPRRRAGRRTTRSKRMTSSRRAPRRRHAHLATTRNRCPLRCKFSKTFYGQ